MSVKEKLLEELGCAITAVYGDKEDEEYESGSNQITQADIDLISSKVKFYLDLVR